MIERDLFGAAYPDEGSAGAALQQLAAARRRQGYEDV
jgi:hypothetical protein